jgi:hypothetical protein
MAFEGKLGEALDELDSLGGFRVFIHLPGDASDASALAAALPWVVGDGVPRDGTIVRVFARKSGVVVATGGDLTDAELEGLERVRASIADVLKTMWVLPPRGSPAPTYERLEAAGLLPPEPPKRTYQPWGLRAVAILCLMLAAALFRLGRRSGTPFFAYVAVGIGLLGVTMFAVSFFWQAARDIENENPSALVAQRWYPLTLMRG